MESQNIINLLDSNDNESQKFATKRWYIINDHVEKAEDLDIVMPMHNLLEYSDTYCYFVY